MLTGCFLYPAVQSADERAAFKVNKEEHLAPLLALAIKRELGLEPGGAAPAAADAAAAPKAKKPRRVSPELLSILATELACSQDSIRDFELQLYDTQPAAIGGASDEFVFAPRLDNLSSCFAALEAICEHAATGLEEDGDVSLVAFFDHEECGSQSAQGAGSPVIKDALERVSEALMMPGTPKEMHKVALSKSFLISSDTAHAIHPNYANKHESNHQPKMCDGTVIKTNSNQRYATNMLTGFYIRELARQGGFPIQEFVVRNDCPCGTTIGPIVSAFLGIRAVDVGAPILSMHSIREQLACDDMDALYDLCVFFFKEFDQVDSIDINMCSPCSPSNL